MYTRGLGRYAHCSPVGMGGMHTVHPWGYGRHAWYTPVEVWETCLVYTRGWEEGTLVYTRGWEEGTWYIHPGG